MPKNRRKCKEDVGWYGGVDRIFGISGQHGINRLWSNGRIADVVPLPAYDLNATNKFVTQKTSVVHPPFGNASSISAAKLNLLITR